MTQEFIKAFEPVLSAWIKSMSVKERLQLIQKIAEMSVQELNILEAEQQKESP